MLGRKLSSRRCVAAGLILLLALPARAQEVDAAAQVKTPSIAVDQLIYKGVVGNLLEAVPLEPEKRVELQRANAVIGTPLTARSLAVLLGVASPVLMIGGLVWGIFAASRIKAAAPSVAPNVARAGLCTDDAPVTIETAKPDSKSTPPVAPVRDELAAVQP